MLPIFFRKETYNVNKYFYYVLICLAYVLISYFNNNFLFTEEIYYNYLGRQHSIETISKIFEAREKWSWLSYLIIPLYSFLKIACVSICLFTGTFLGNYNISLRKLFHISLIAEIIFVVYALIKMIWFCFLKSDYTFLDLKYFSPFSALFFFDYEELNDWIIYPLQVINIFELSYFFALACGLSIILREK